MLKNKRVLKTGVLAATMAIVFTIFAFRAAEWTKGLSSEFIVYGASNSGGGTTTGGGAGGGGGATTKVIAQIAAGSYDNDTHYGTVVEIVNPNTSAVMLSGNFYNEDGTASTLHWTVSEYSANGTIADFTGSFSNVSLPAGSIFVFGVGTGQTNTPATGTTNWGKITATNNISVASFFELRHYGDNALLSRVGIPASRGDLSSFVIPRLRRKQPANSALAEADSGFAVVNTGSVTATITAKLIDANGNTIATDSFPLAANAHKVGIVNSAFTFLNNETTGPRYHYVVFSSDQPSVGAAAIAFEGGSLTSFPVDALQ